MDQTDLERLHARLEKSMYNVAFRWTWQEEDAHDLVQEAFVRLWGMRRRVDPATVEPLAYRILINLAASRSRKRKLWRWVSLEAIRETESEGAGRGARPARRRAAGPGAPCAGHTARGSAPDRRPVGVHADDLRRDRPVARHRRRYRGVAPAPCVETASSLAGTGGIGR